MMWLVLLLLLLCAPAFLLAATGMLVGVGALVLGFVTIWVILFALLAAVGAEVGTALLAAFGLAFPASWVILGRWDPETNS